VSKKARLKRQIQQGDKIPVKIPVKAEPTPLGRRYKIYFSLIAVFCVCFMAFTWAVVGSRGQHPTESPAEMYRILERYADSWALTHPHLVSWEVREPADSLGDDRSRPVATLVLHMDDEATPQEVAEWERFLTKWTALTVGAVRNYSGYVTEVRRIDADVGV